MQVDLLWTEKITDGPFGNARMVTNYISTEMIRKNMAVISTEPIPEDFVSDEVSEPLDETRSSVSKLRIFLI